MLWLQENQLRRIIELAKILGTEDTADLMTKNLRQETLSKHAAALNYEFRKGRSNTTAKFHAMKRNVNESDDDDGDEKTNDDEFEGGSEA